MVGAINLIENFKVKEVIFNCGQFNNLENELIKVLDKKIPYYSCIKELNIYVFSFNCNDLGLDELRTLYYREERYSKNQNR